MWHSHANLRGILLSALAILGLGVTAPSPVTAATVDWTVWSSITPGSPTGGSAAGTLTGVTVGYTGEALASSYTGFGPPPAGAHPSWTPGSTFSGGTVGNAPTNSGSIALSGGPATTIDTLTFSPAVIDPVIAIWSLGSAGLGSPAQFDFLGSPTLSVQGGGPNTETGGSSIIVGPFPNDVTGIEGNGVVQFVGTFTSLSWSTPDLENDYAFTVGAEGVVPEPASIGLLVLAGIAAMRNRRSR
jgi:hypothetical protein